MPVLTCAATTCIYNKDKLCSRGDIKVTGEDATYADATSCGSFVERESTTSNAHMEGGCGCATIDVRCEACKCVFNKDEKCSADEIEIEGSNACESEETECGSFRCKNC